MCGEPRRSLLSEATGEGATATTLDAWRASGERGARGLPMRGDCSGARVCAVVVVTVVMAASDVNNSNSEHCAQKRDGSRFAYD